MTDEQGLISFFDSVNYHWLLVSYATLYYGTVLVTTAVFSLKTNADTELDFRAILYSTLAEVVVATTF